MGESLSNLIDLSNILNDLSCHNLTDLASKLAIDKDDVYKMLVRLQDYGVKIDLTKQESCQLHEALSFIDEQYIRDNINNPNLDIILFETIDSTNEYLKKISSKNAILKADQELNSNLSGERPECTSEYMRTRTHDKFEEQSLICEEYVCIAEHQSKGKGRMSRKWHSPFAKNIYLSYGFVFNGITDDLSGLALVVSIALVEALKETIKADLMIKWPNDITYKGEKIIGILIEIINKPSQNPYVIIGIGINVNMKEDVSGEITKKWCSLANIAGSDIDRSKLCVKIIDKLTGYLDKFNKQGFPYFIDAWNKLDILANQEIKVMSGNVEYQGKAIGVDQEGNLLIEQGDGSIKTCFHGDTTIIPISR